MSTSRKINSESFFELDTFSERCKFLLNYAVLAPSTHNSQPWLFKITDNSCKIYYDPSKALEYADPIKRDLFISIGCCVENFLISAKYFKMFDGLNYDFQNDDNLVVEIFLKENNQNLVDDNYLELLEAIQNRYNARGFFDKSSLGLEEIESLTDKASSQVDLPKQIEITCLSEQGKIADIADLTAEGIKIANNNINFRKEFNNWFHSSYTKKKYGIPGFAVNMPGVLSLFIPTLAKFFNLGKILAKLNSKSIESSQYIFVFSSKQSGKSDWLSVGMVCQRLMLELVSKGLQNSIFAASIEMGNLNKKLKEIISLNTEPHFLFVSGLIKNAKRFTPRYQVENKIIK